MDRRKTCLSWIGRKPCPTEALQTSHSNSTCREPAKGEDIPCIMHEDTPEQPDANVLFVLGSFPSRGVSVQPKAVRERYSAAQSRYVPRYG
jgi:hypothetical protein